MTRDDIAELRARLQESRRELLEDIEQRQAALANT